MRNRQPLFQRIGYQFADQSLLELALSHRSSGKANNERLEFVGDSILGFLIAESLYQTYPHAKEGELSRIRAELVKKSTLAEVARELGLNEYLILGAGELKTGGANRDSTLADALEALVSALYFDAGLDVCRHRVLSWFSRRLQYVSPERAPKDAKTRLQEYLQSRKLQLPDYQVADVSGKEHEQVFSVHCNVGALNKTMIGKGGSIREAEQHAAEAALLALGL